MKISGIYKIQSLIRPEKIYIGSAIDMKKRWVGHSSLLKLNKHHSIKLQNHYNKYGESDLIFIIVELCFPEFLTAREQYYINKLKPWFNICKIAGSQLGIKRSEETKKKCSEAKKGNKVWLGKHHKEESKKKIGESKKGNKYILGHHFNHSEKTKKRMSESKKGENNPNFGKNHSEETKKKMSEKRLAFYETDKGKELKQKLSETDRSGENNPNYGKFYKTGI